MRTKLKMELLREHLKTYISEDYSYSQKLDSSPVPTMLVNKLKKKEDMNEEENDA